MKINNAFNYVTSDGRAIQFLSVLKFCIHVLPCFGAMSNVSD